jgi:hypothetical protein
LQIAISKNGQIIAILQIAIYKKGQIIEILQITIYKMPIIAILQIIKIPLYREFFQIYKNGQIINGQNATRQLILHLRRGSFRPF